MSQKLSAEEIKAALAELGGWTLQDEVLVWQKGFGSFSEAFAFVARTALLAEKRDHHPDILLSYTQVTLRLTSHDAGGLTARDVGFARAVGAF